MPLLPCRRYVPLELSKTIQTTRDKRDSNLQTIRATRIVARACVITSWATVIKSWRRARALPSSPVRAGARARELGSKRCELDPKGRELDGTVSGDDPRGQSPNPGMTLKVRAHVQRAS